MMPLKAQEAPCWVLAYPDGTLAGQWDERHFGDEDEAADVLDCEGDDPGLAGVAPRILAAPCFTVVCDGCGEPYRDFPDSYLISHFMDRADAASHASGVSFGDDGTMWCEECPSPAGAGRAGPAG